MTAVRIMTNILQDGLETHITNVRTGATVRALPSNTRQRIENNVALEIDFGASETRIPIGSDSRTHHPSPFPASAKLNGLVHPLPLTRSPSVDLTLGQHLAHPASQHPTCCKDDLLQKRC
jgi:hypothetical protein